MRRQAASSRLPPLHSIATLAPWLGRHRCCNVAHSARAPRAALCYSLGPARACPLCRTGGWSCACGPLAAEPLLRRCGPSCRASAACPCRIYNASARRRCAASELRPRAHGALLQAAARARFVPSARWNSAAEMHGRRRRRWGHGRWRVKGLVSHRSDVVEGAQGRRKGSGSAMKMVRRNQSAMEW